MRFVQRAATATAFAAALLLSASERRPGDLRLSVGASAWASSCCAFDNCENMTGANGTCVGDICSPLCPPAAHNDVSTTCVQNGLDFVNPILWEMREDGPCGTQALAGEREALFECARNALTNDFGVALSYRGAMPYQVQNDGNLWPWDCLGNELHANPTVNAMLDAQCTVAAAASTEVFMTADASGVTVQHEACFPFDVVETLEKDKTTTRSVFPVVSDYYLAPLDLVDWVHDPSFQTGMVKYTWELEAQFGQVDPTLGSLTSNDTQTPDPYGSGNVVAEDTLKASAEGRVAPTLRLAAKTDVTALEKLGRAAAAHAAGDVRLANALADLAVTGRVAFASFTDFVNTASFPPGAPLDSIQAAIADATIASAGGLVNNDANRAHADVVLKRAFAVANAIRTGAPSRGSITTETGTFGTERWIAVSGEDDMPHRPVNVMATKYRQFDITVPVPRRQMTCAESGTPATSPPSCRTRPPLSVQTRYMIAYDKPGPRNTWEVPFQPVDPYAITPLPAPALPPDAEVVLYIHGMDSRLEEAEPLADALIKLGRESTPRRNFVVISVDLPTSGYADKIDHRDIAPDDASGHPGVGPEWKWPTPSPALQSMPNPSNSSRWWFTESKVVTPLLDFDEDFVVAFVNTLDMSMSGALKAGMKAFVGGSLGGNLTMRLDRADGLPYVTKFASWSAASMWDSAIVDPANYLALTTAYGRWTDYPESPFSRREFFKGVWDDATIGGAGVTVLPAQPEMWYSYDWPCKRTTIDLDRLDRHETYSRNFRTWHWRLGAEQLIYSHRLEVEDKASGQKKPLYLYNTKPMLVECGYNDNFPFVSLCDNAEKTAAKMKNTPGRFVLLGNTGHSIHNERPAHLAKQIEWLIDRP